MKISLIIAVLVLVVGAIPALHGWRQAAAAKRDCAKLREQATALGIALPAAAGDAMRQRRDREAMRRRGDELATGLAEVARRMDTAGDGMAAVGGDLHHSALEWIARLNSLDAEEIERVLGALRTDESLTLETRRRLFTFALIELASRQPEAALRMFADTPEAFHGSGLLADQVVPTALEAWAGRDPAAALAWLQAHEDSRPELVDELARHSILSGLAAGDPARAFAMLDALGIDDGADALDTVLAAGDGSPESRALAVDALRAHLVGMADPDARTELAEGAFGQLARTVGEGDFDTTSGWLESMNLSPGEKTWFGEGLSWYMTRDKTGRWVDWISQNLPPGEIDDPVRELVGEWTQQDYVAAGEWLSGGSDGPARAPAVEAYAAAVAEYEPQIAVQWALTLPEGPGRNATLRAVFENWPASDPAGAAEFARNYGLE